MIRIGTSGWVYKHWREIFYPANLRQADWFAFFARHFDTVEINNSFYRLPSDAAFEGWHRQAPPGFLYAVKASRYITHMKKLIDPEEPLRVFFERAAVLRPYLGPVLFQLPPNFPANLPRFEHFLSVLPKEFTHAIEFRDPTWLTEDVFRLMERYGVSHCIHDMRPLEIPIRLTAAPAYVRFHGAHKYSGDYAEPVLESWAQRLVEWERQGVDGYVYFNNDIGGFALKNARQLREMVERIRGA